MVLGNNGSRRLLRDGGGGLLFLLSLVLFRRWRGDGRCRCGGGFLSGDPRCCSSDWRGGGGGLLLLLLGLGLGECVHVGTAHLFALTIELLLAGRALLLALLTCETDKIDSIINSSNLTGYYNIFRLLIFCAARFRTEAPGKRELHNTWSEILKASGDRGKRKGGRWRRPRSDSGGTTIPCLPLLLRRPPSPPPEFPSMAGEYGQVELLDDVRRMVLPHGPRHHPKSRPSFLREERGGRRSRPKELLSRRTGASSPALFQRLPSRYRRLTGGRMGSRRSQKDRRRGKAECVQ